MKLKVKPTLLMNKTEKNKQTMLNTSFSSLNSSRSQSQNKENVHYQK